MSHDEMKVVLLHAYRRSNSGDGLLVDAAAQMVREALPGARIRLISLEPGSFPEYPGGLHPLGGERGSMTVGGLLRSGLLRRPHPLVEEEIRSAALAVAVGGGYMRMGTFSEGLKTVLAHIAQTPQSRIETPYIYLPQSIGPFPSSVPVGIRRLRRAREVFVRDDRSREELQAVGVTSERVPDLAVMRLASEGIVSQQPTAEGTGLIARSLTGRSDSYHPRLRRLVADLKPELLVQSRGAGNDDPAFYSSMGWTGDHRSARDALHGSRKPKVVVSVRLHGALQSILAGVPAVHLSYERKGWGAYEDIGISPYVHNAWTFDPDLVASQVRELAEDATSYWDAISAELPRVEAARNRVIAAIRDTARETFPPASSGASNGER